MPIRDTDPRDQNKRRGYKVDLKGKTFGRYTVVDWVAPMTTEARCGKWKCVCQCGTVRLILTGELNSGLRKSCGCLISDRSKALLASRNGRLRPRAKEIFVSMHKRCSNPKSRGYDRYGAKGISVCERWSSFDAFINDMGEPPDGHSLDRIDNTLGYSPENCRWATPTQQSKNRRYCYVLIVDGKKLDTDSAAVHFGCTRNALLQRIRKGKVQAERLGSQA